MKKTLLITSVFALILFSCKSKKIITVPVDYTNYEVNSAGESSQGTTKLQVFSYGYSKKNAIEKAKMDAVHAVLFKGIPGSNFTKPMVKNGRNKNKEYFDNFFGLYKVKVGKREKVDPLKLSKVFDAPYKLYVQSSNEGSIYGGDIQRVGDKYRAKVIVTVNHQELRKKNGARQNN